MVRPTLKPGSFGKITYFQQGKSIIAYIDSQPVRTINGPTCQEFLDRLSKEKTLLAAKRARSLMLGALSYAVRRGYTH